MVRFEPVKCNADERCLLRLDTAEPLFSPVAKMQIESTILFRKSSIACAIELLTC